MRFEFKSFRTRVARRIFLLFIICAVLPITILSAISYYMVKSQMDASQFKRLRQESKAISTSIYERLLFLQGELSRLAVVLEVLSTGSDPEIPATLQNLSQGLFTRIRIEDMPLSGSAGKGPFWLVTETSEKGNGQMSMWMALPEKTKRLVGTLNPNYLWEAGIRLPEKSGVCILSQTRDFSQCTDDTMAEPIEKRLAGAGWPHRGVLNWEDNHQKYRAGFTNLFLEANFNAGEWTVVMVESTPEDFALRKGIAITFPAAIVFSLGLVFMLGQYLIRRNMGPIEILKDATRRIAEGEFGHIIDIRSGDEFEDLGRSFNEMSRRLEESRQLLLRTARLGTMGQMASGFVHEVKQPMSAIYGLIQLIALREKDKEKMRMLETVTEAVQNLDETLNRFSSFSKDKPIEMIPLNVNDVVEEICRLLSVRFAKRSIAIRKEMEEDLPMISGDRRGIQQILSNILVNALDALEEDPKDDRALVIRTHSQNGQVILAVSDNGCGIPDEIQEKIFDPFYTTKSPEKGTGIGMAIVESIVHQHDAEIILESEAGRGTTVRVIFPVETGGETI